MNVSFIAIYGLFSLVHGVMDAIKLIDVLVNTSASLFSRSLGFSYNFKVALYLADPAALLLGALFAYLLYRWRFDDAPEYAPREPVGGGGRRSENYGSADASVESASPARGGGK